MKTKTLNFIIVFLVVGLLMCVAVLVRQHLQLASFQAQLAETELHVYQVEKASNIDQANRASITQIRSLPSGIYEVKTEVVVDPIEDTKTEYTIYHFILNIEVGAFKRRLQFGYASSGLFSHVFYFDYDNDGKIDTSMMEEYADSIPAIGKAVSWLIDPELSQSLYNSFRLNSDNAKKLSLDVIASRVDNRIEIVSEWIKESSSDFGEWVEDAAGLN